MPPRRARLLALYLADGFRVVDIRTDRRMRVRLRKGLFTVTLDLDREDAETVLAARRKRVAQDG